MVSRHSLAATLCVLIWLGAAQTQEQATIAAPSIEPRMTIDVSRTHVALSGDVSSVAHESILRQRAVALFPRKSSAFEFRERPALPPGWALVSELALRAVAETYISRTEITSSRIHFRGITNSAAAWHDGVSRLEGKLLPDMRLEREIIEIDSTDSFRRHCISLFRTAMRERTIDFPSAGATLGTSYSPLLDELIQISADCPAATIVITGHTDNSGDESGNFTLSKARADAVAAYLHAGGIAAQRVMTAGAGSARPLVADDTARAQQLNRRIEIEMTFPED